MDAFKECLTLSADTRPYSVMTNRCGGPDVMAGAHWHDAYEILFIRNGSCLQRINTGTVRIQTGGLVVIRPGDVHATQSCSANGCVIDVLQFMSGVIRADGAMLPELPSACPLTPGMEFQALARRFDELKLEVTRPGPGQFLILTGLIRELAGQIFRVCADTSAVDTRSIANSIFADVCLYLEKAADLHLTSVAARFNYAPEHLSRKFRAELGVSYKSHCDGIRMRRAICQLRAGVKNISEIAENCGYSSASSFIRAFRRIYNISPHQYALRRIPISLQDI